MIITVTATVTFEYDTEDEVASTPEEAVEDVRSMIANRELTSNDFTIGWK